MRLFVAVWPPADVIAQLAALERPELERVRWTTRDQWHVTLRFIGELADPAEVVSALSPAPPAGRATARLGPRSEVLGQAYLCLPATGLDRLAEWVTTATAHLGRLESRPFRGHLTLARGNKKLPRGAPKLELAASWVVDEVTVVASHLRRDGARYEIVASVAVV